MGKEGEREEKKAGKEGMIRVGIEGGKREEKAKRDLELTTKSVQI